MKTTIYIITTLCLLSMACNQTEDNHSKLSRIIFDAHGQRPISSSVNRNLGTMSILYGNPEAYQSALVSNGEHIAGEEYTYVTWKYGVDPVYDGSDINGELLSVEEIEVASGGDGRTAINYQIKKGEPLPVNGKHLKENERIAYIFEHQPSILP